MNNALFIAMLLVIAGILTYGKTVHFSARSLKLFRVLFPSWRFFEDLTELPRLHYRVARPGEELGNWIPALNRPERSWAMGLLNPQGNLYLALQSLLQQVESDIADLKEREVENFSESVSYRLCRAFALDALNSDRADRGPLRFQFRLSRWFQGAPDSALEPFLTSVVEELP